MTEVGVKCFHALFVSVIEQSFANWVIFEAPCLIHLYIVSALHCISSDRLTHWLLPTRWPNLESVSPNFAERLDVILGRILGIKRLNGWHLTLICKLWLSRQKHAIAPAVDTCLLFID